MRIQANTTRLASYKTSSSKFKKNSAGSSIQAQIRKIDKEIAAIRKNDKLTAKQKQQKIKLLQLKKQQLMMQAQQKKSSTKSSRQSTTPNGQNQDNTINIMSYTKNKTPFKTTIHKTVDVKI